MTIHDNRSSRHLRYENPYFIYSYISLETKIFLSFSLSCFLHKFVILKIVHEFQDRKMFFLMNDNGDLVMATTSSIYSFCYRISCDVSLSCMDMFLYCIFVLRICCDSACLASFLIGIFAMNIVSRAFYTCGRVPKSQILEEEGVCEKW